jgi:UDP-GlcNAc:undecaprenyl-phosphate GlcNAc-1-phosphate transferase
MEKLAVAIVVAFMLPIVLTPLVKKLALKMGAVDAPNQRKVHSRIMPRLGGLAIYAAFIAAVLAFVPLTKPILGLLAGATLIMLLGVVDDIRGLPPRLKLLGQIGAALIVVYFGVSVGYITNPLKGMVDSNLLSFGGEIPGWVLQNEISLGFLSIPFTIFWIIGITNAVNLIDGLDGLAAGMALIASVTLAIIAWTEGNMAVVYLALILAGATLGFLKYNFHPAQIFMGDTGSMFLGFALASLAIMGLGKSATIISLLIPILILGIPIFDTALAIVRRYLKAKPIFQADKEHLHHQLLALGLSHKQTVLVIYGLNGVLGASAVLLTQLTTAQGMMILTVLSVAGLLGAERLGVIGSRFSLAKDSLAKDKETFRQSGK